jgi:hypothetical protein
MDEPLMSWAAITLGPKAISASECVGILTEACAGRKVLE